MSQEIFPAEANLPRSEETERLIERRDTKLSREGMDWYHSVFEVDGKYVENLGVYHDPAALKEYGRELEAAIQRASVVVMEEAPTAVGEYSEVHIDRMLKLAGERGIRLSKEEVADQLNNQTSRHFFRVLEGIAAREGKPIAVVDPHAPDRFEEQEEAGRREVRKVNTGIESVKLGAFLAGIAGIIGPEVVSQKGEQGIGADDTAGITRRTFLKRMIQGAGVVALTPTIINSLNSGDRSTGIVRKAAYDYYDFRDVTSMKGLRVLAKKNFGAGPILLIHASPHSRAIEFYNSHPQLTETKYQAYRPLRDAQQPKLRTYQFKNNEWELTEREDIR